MTATASTGETSPTIPLGSWLRRAADLAALGAPDPFGPLVRALERDRRRNGYQVCVVGLSRNGRSTVINELLGRTVLGTARGEPGESPATLRIRAGEADVLETMGPDGVLRTPSPGPVSPPRTGDATLEVAQSWLSGTGIELFEPPGEWWQSDDPRTPGDPEAGRRADDVRARAIRAVVAGSDAVVLVLSALAPLSLDELDLLHREVLGHHVAQVHVVLTKLDLVPEEEHAETLAHTQARLPLSRGPLPVLARVPGTDWARPLREHLIAASVAPGRDRDRQTARRLADGCRDLATAVARAQAADLLDAVGRTAETERRVAGLDAGSGDWEGLRIELTGRQLSTQASVRRLLLEQRERLLRAARHRLERAPDPRQWWDRDLPHELERDLTELAGFADRAIATSLRQDLTWLDAQIRARLPRAAAREVPVVSVAPVPAEPVAEIPDLGRTKLVARLGGQSGALLGMGVAYLVGASVPAFALIFGMAGGLIAESKIRQATGSQRQLIDSALTRVIDENLTQFGARVAGCVDRLYLAQVGRLREDHDRWHGEQLSAIDAAAGDVGGTDWGRLSEGAVRLAGDIDHELRSPGGTTA